MVIYFKAYINSQLYILGRAKLHWNFSSILKDDSDIHRFSNRKASGAFLIQLEIFQHSSALPNIKYKYSVLFCVICIDYICILCMSRILFFANLLCSFADFLAKVKIYWCFRRVLFNNCGNILWHYLHKYIVIWRVSYSFYYRGL